MRSAWLIVVLVSCQQQQKVFDVGAVDDPVLALALGTAPTTTFTVTVTNRTSYAWSEGLITLLPTFTVNTVANAALVGYADNSPARPTVGNATTYAAALGLQLGVTAFVVPAIPAGQTRSAVVVAPADSPLSYIARVISSEDDFVAVTQPSSGASVRLSGYDIDDGSGGRIAANNGTTGGTLPNGTNLTRVNNNPCKVPTMTAAARLHTQDFSKKAPPDYIGPSGDPDFNGDWLSNGETANLTLPTTPQPTVTGFVHFIDVCPLSTAVLTATALVDNRNYTQATSDNTLVVYYWDSAGTLITAVPTYAIHAPNRRTLRLDRIGIPAQTRRIGIVPMAYIAAGETGIVSYDDVVADYLPEPPSDTKIAVEDFSTLDGWTKPEEFIAHENGFATVWNPSWGGGALPFDAAMSKTFDLAGKQTLSFELFAASTMQVGASFVQLQLAFSDGSTVDGEPLYGPSYSRIDIRDVSTTASSVTVTVRAHLAAGETSSFYVDDLVLIGR